MQYALIGRGAECDDRSIREISQCLESWQDPANYRGKTSKIFYDHGNKSNIIKDLGKEVKRNVFFPFFYFNVYVRYRNVIETIPW